MPIIRTRLHPDFDEGIDGLGMRGAQPVGYLAVTSGLLYRLDQRTLDKFGARSIAGTLIQNGRVVIELHR